jgi:hypothetical protein
MPRRARRVVAAALGALVAWVALSSSTPAANTLIERRPATVTSTTVPAALQRAVLRDYEAYWHALFAASDPPRPDDPRLAQYGTGQALGDARQVLASDAAGGLVHRGLQALDPNVTSLTGNTATVRDCYRNDWLPYALQGNTLGLPPGTRLETPSVRLRIVALQLDGSTWKTTASTPAYPQQRSCGTLAAEQRVIDAYKNYERVMYAVSLKAPRDPNDPRLKRVLARQDNALAQVQDNIRRDRAQGLVRRRASPSAIESGRADVVSYTPGSATVQACFVDDGTVTDGATGRTISPPDTTPTSWTYTLVAEPHIWKVAGVTKGGACSLAA